MIGVDTNVLVRFLTGNDASQHSAVMSFFAARTAAEPAYIGAVTLAETVWVLRRRYGLPVDEIVESLAMIIDSDDFVVEGREAVDAARSGTIKPSQLTDCLVALLNERAGCSRTLTFDRSAARVVPSMELLA